MKDGAPFDEVNERAAEYARDRSGELIKGIEDTTLARIRAAEERAIRDGLTPAELAESIDAVIDDEARAANIARTELARAQMTSALEAAARAGVATGKRSLLSNDHDVEDVCDECADAGVIPLNDPFPSGELSPPHHPGGCRCDMAVEV